MSPLTTRKARRRRRFGSASGAVLPFSQHTKGGFVFKEPKTGGPVDPLESLLPYWSSCNTVRVFVLACASIAVADWVRMAFFVYSTISEAMSASRMRDSAA